MDAFFRLLLVSPRCSVLSSHAKKSFGSLCFSMVKRLSLAAMTACMNSCGLTCKAAQAPMSAAGGRLPATATKKQDDQALQYCNRIRCD